MANETIQLKTIGGDNVNPAIDISNLIEEDSGLIIDKNTGKLEISTPIPVPAVKNNNKVLTCEHNYDTNTDEIVWKNRCYCDEDKINLSFAKLDTDTFGSGDTPYETIMVYRPASSWPDWKHNPSAKLDVYPEYKNTESFVNDNLYVEWPKAEEDFPTPMSVGDIIEYKLVAEITEINDDKPTIELKWMKI